MKRLIINSFVVFLLIFSHATLAKKLSADGLLAQKAYYAWCKSISTAKGDPAVVVKYYAPNAVLIPTLSHKILVNKNGGLDDYFKKLTSMPNIQCRTQKLRTDIHEGFIINSGFYRFSYTNEEGETVLIPSRFTFVYKKIGNEWLIVKHHSSKAPPE